MRFRKYISILFGICLAFMRLNAQVGSTIDQEYQLICMMDSISPTSEIEFARKYYVNKGSYENLNSGLTASYTIVGTPIPCYQLTGTAECWLITVQRPRNTYSYAVGIGATIENSDYSLVALKLEEHLSQQLRRPRRDYVIPINYPYRNTQYEADRLERDLIEYFECKKICYWDVNVVVGTRSLEPSVTIIEYGMMDAVYSTNLVTPFPDSSYYMDNAVLVVGANTSCGGVAQVYRKELNGAVLYYIDDLGVLNPPPIPATAKKIDCNYITNERDDCDRIGSSQCMIAPSQNEVCSYYLQLDNLDTIQGLYLDGVDVVTADVHPNLGTNHKNITSFAQNHIDLNWKFGIFSTNDHVSAAAEGWILQLNYSEASFDSLVTNRGTYYPRRSDCRNFHFYNVTKNELGGIVSVTDELGQYLLAPPDQARIVSCESISTYDINCEVLGEWGTEELDNVSKAFDLKDFWSFSYYVTSGPITLTTTDYSGTTVNVILQTGFTESFSNADPCSYLNTKSITLDATTSKKIKVSYQW